MPASVQVCMCVFVGAHLSMFTCILVSEPVYIHACLCVGMCYHVSVGIYACLHMFACARWCVYVCTWVSAHVCMLMPLCLCACPCLHTRVHSRYMAGCTLGVRRLRVELQALSQVSKWPRCDLYPPLWLRRSSPLETRELSFGIKWPHCLRRAESYFQKQTGPSSYWRGWSREPCLILKECVRVPAQQSRPQPAWEPRSTRPAVVAFGTGSLLVRDKSFQGQTVTQICEARVGGGGGGERGPQCLP